MTLEPSSLGDARPLQLEDFTSQRQGEAGPPEGDREGAALLHSPTGGESEGGGGCSGHFCGQPLYSTHWRSD